MWNHRVVRHVTPEQEYFAIHECFYRDGKLSQITQDPVAAFGDTATELAQNYVLMAGAFAKRVVDFDTLEELDTPAWVFDNDRPEPTISSVGNF